MDPARPFEPRTSRRGLAVVAALLALTIAGCGGSQVEYQEVPGEPAEITLPDRSPAAADEAETGDDAAAAEDSTPEPTATPAAETGAATDGTTSEESATAEATPAPVEDSPETDEPPVPGSDAERFEDFCEQNAGAC